MTTKKKSRPSFEVPAEVESGAQSGWVYRSGEGPKPVSSIEPDLLEAESAATATLAMAMAAVAQAVVLGMTLVAIPWTMGLRTLRTLARPR
jgi:hypothetical protein